LLAVFFFRQKVKVKILEIAYYVELSAQEAVQKYIEEQGLCLLVSKHLKELDFR
jgi:hypothetical protein